MVWSQQIRLCTWGRACFIFNLCIDLCTWLQKHAE